MCRHSRLARSVPDASRGRAATRSQSLPNRDSPPPESPRTHPCRHPTPNGIVQTALRRPAGEWTLRAREAYGLQATPSSWSLHQAESRLLGLSASSRPSPLPSNTELPPDGELPLELELPVEQRARTRGGDNAKQERRRIGRRLSVDHRQCLLSKTRAAQGS